MVLAHSELKILIEKNNLVDNINIDYALQGSSLDLCIGETAKIHRKTDLIDLSKDVDLEGFYEEIELAKKYELKSGEYMYASTIEKVNIPHDKCAILLPRSSFARMGLILPVSQYANPGYQGHLPIVIFNASPSPVYIPPYYRVMQMIIMELKGVATTYGEQKNHKYHNENSGTIPSFDDVEIEQIRAKLYAKL